MGFLSPAPSVSLLPEANIALFFTADASDLAGYKAFSLILPTEASTTVGASISGAGIAIEEWASPLTFHTPLLVPQGTWQAHVHVQRTAGGGQAQVFAGLYKRTAGGVETLLGTLGPFNVNDNNEHEENIDVTLADKIFAIDDRIVLKWYANKVVGTGSDPTVTLIYRGDTASRLEFPITTTSLDHGLLSGLSDDDHTQYLLLEGRTGGQTVEGDFGVPALGTPSTILNVKGNAGEWGMALAVDGVSGASAIQAERFDAVVAYPLNLNPKGGNVGVGTETPLAKLAVNGGVHIGGDTDPGDNNLLVDGTIDATGALTAATVNGLSAVQVTDLTDAGATTLHKHDHGGMDGLTDNDHLQYMTPLAETILGVDAASVTFSAIPATYRHLMLVCQGTTDEDTNLFDNIVARFNADSGANYSVQFMTAQGAVVNAGELLSQTEFIASQFGTEASVATRPGGSALMIPYYADTTFEKTAYTAALSVAGAVNAADNLIFLFLGGRWSDTDAITSITLFPTTGANITAGSVFTLYGMSKLP